MGQQKLSLSHWSSPPHHRARRPIHPLFFWHRPRRYSSPRRPISSGLTPCAVAKNSPFLSAAATSRRSRPNPLLSSLARRSHATRDLVHPRAGQRGGKKLHDRQDPRSLAFSPEQRRTGLFADYVNTWLKVKQESSGWPSWSKSVDQKREYILRYQEREGIRLDIASICQKSQTQGHGQADAKQFLG